MIAVVGPTAAGKSDLALILAQRFDGEVVNADAFQFYRGMDIGTAKPTPTERARVPHHCIDILDLDQAASVADFQATARAAVDAIVGRGRLPVIVGGSALYVRALCDRLDIPPRDPQVRARLTAEAEQMGSAAMFERLRLLDPAAAEHIDPRNHRRVIRALEVVELTGSFTSRLPDPQSWRPTLWLSPAWSRPDLDRRIQARTEQMWRDGLLAEVRGLMSRGLAVAPTARMAVGYPQAMAVVAGTATPDTAIRDTVAATRKLARRQERIFRSDPRIRSVPGDCAESATGPAVEMVAGWLAGFS